MSGEEPATNQPKGSATPISLPSSPPPDTPWSPPPVPPRGRWWTAISLSILAGVLASSLLSPLHFASMLSRALQAGDEGRIGVLVDCRLLSSCLGVEAVLSPADLVKIYSAPSQTRRQMEPWERSWGEFPRVSISGLSYRGMTRAEIRLSDGSVLNLERRGLWTWRLFCAEIP